MLVANSSKLDILFCVMPFSPCNSPNLGVSILKSLVTDLGISAQILYNNVDYMSQIGVGVHDKVSGEDGILDRFFGELIFSEYLFGKPLDIEGLVTNSIAPDSRSSDLDKVLEAVYCARKQIPKFIDKCAERIVLRHPRLIGFSTSYYQNCSSLLLAKKIREKVNTPIIFGGANCEGEMGNTLLKCFPQIDFICSGDGEHAFIKFVKHLLIEENNSTTKICGILTRESEDLDIHLTDPLMNMDGNPLPDFSDYFIEIEKNNFRKYLQVEIGIESSRGCWWGEVSQCTFCGLNGSTMKYRSKSPERVIRELDTFEKRYDINLFHFVDNILDPKFFTHLFDNISENQMDVNIFYETKAPLLKQHLFSMKRAGINAIQPGIESLSDIILELMKKGTTTLENISLLKSCLELEIRVYWNIITGFPGEPEEEYTKMQELIPQLVHLEPPILCGKFMLSRYSPYFNEPLKYGITNVKPSSIYEKIYPFETKTLQGLCYFFDHDYQDNRDVISYTSGLQHEIEEWKRLWRLEKEIPELSILNAGKLKIIRDTRPCAVQKMHFLFGGEAEIYEICKKPSDLKSIAVSLKVIGMKLTDEELLNILNSFLHNKLILRIKNRYLSLAVPKQLLKT